MKKVNIKLPGLRIIKTVVTAFIVMLIAHFSNGILRPYDMVIVAVLAIQSDVAESFNEVKNRLSATLIGGIIGTIIMCINYISSSDIVELFLVPFGIFSILYFCSKLIKKSEFIIIACYAFLAITLDEPATISWLYPIRVMANTIVASIVAMIVNLYSPKIGNTKKISVVNFK